MEIYLTNPLELDNVSGGTTIIFKCIKCGEEVRRTYWPYRKEQCKLFMCKKCKTSDNKSTNKIVYTKENPIFLTDPKQLDEICGGSYFSYKCKICNKIETHEYWPYRKELYTKFLCKKHKTESTNIETYGRKYNIGVEETISKSLETQRKNNNGLLWQQTEEGRKSLSELNKSHSEWREKAAETYKNKTGYSSPFANPEVIKLSRANERKKRNGLLHVQTDEFKEFMSEQNRLHPEWKEKSIEAQRKNNNGLMYFETDEFKNFMSEQNKLHPEWQEKSAKVLLEKYGVNSPVNIPGIIDKIAKTDKENHDGIRYSQTEEWRKRVSDMTNKKQFRNSKFKYKDIYFDSSWELKYYIFCIDHDIPIKRATEHFNFIYNGEPWHKYTPDFIINNNEYIEIKGDRFWDNENNKDPNYILARANCAIKNGVKILYKIDLQPIINWFDRKYGKTFLEKYKIDKK